MATQRELESLAAKLAKVRNAMGRNYTPRIKARLDKIVADMDRLEIGQQLAVNMIAARLLADMD